ncbi:MAG TPA: hypothetical protein DCR14_13185 [Acidimicrobiaceae bacterium]|nr:hypothetical protein [Acidimicrobiaceae bacterium]
MSTPTLVERIVAACDALDAAGLPWALGGALALAYATEEPRGTRDIDINVFVPAERAADVFAALPVGVRSSAADIAEARRADQVRLWWDDTPVDLFFAADPFHHEVDRRCRRVPFAGRTIRVLSAEDLAVFKAMFDRPKDWVDIATMAESNAIDLDETADRLAALLPGDPRVERVRRGGV